MIKILEKFIKFIEERNLNLEVIRDKINHLFNVRDSEDMCVCLEVLEECQTEIEPTPSNVLTSLLLFYLTMGTITEDLKSVGLSALEEFLGETTESEVLEFLNSKYL